LLKSLAEHLSAPSRVGIFGAPQGYDALVVGELAAALSPGVLMVCRDDARLARMAEALAFFSPAMECLEFPAWDCLPYDRVSPRSELVSRRIDTLTRLIDEPADPDTGRVVLTTVSAVLQRVPPRQMFAGATLTLVAGSRMDPAELVGFLDRQGYVRVETVLEPGEYAVRGGIVDVFPPGRRDPLRLDFFGDDLEVLRSFDPASQRGGEGVDRAVLKPVSEILLTADAIVRFRSAYRALFGAVRDDDPLYEAVSAGRRFLGMEHWLPLFHPHLETVFDYLPGWAFVLDAQVEPAVAARIEGIDEYYQARRTFAAAGSAAGSASYHPVPKEALFLDRRQWLEALAGHPVAELTPFAGAVGQARVVDAGGRPAVDFADARKSENINVFDAVAARIAGYRRDGLRVMIAAVSAGSRDRLKTILAEHGIPGVVAVDGWPAAGSLPADAVAVAVLDLDQGFVAPGLAAITEQDILGDRMARRGARRVRPENFLTETASLNPGDLVVHADHGIGCYDGLETVTAGGAPHDCLRILYAGGDKLYLPVENIEVISRYGSDAAGVQLDRLGGASWQARKAKLKQRVREMADELLRVAAARALRQAPELAAPYGLYDEFCARFPYVETEDQARAIGDVLADLGAGRPADRLICGDVGFGKTEVALRAAFVTVMDGRQVAVVVPTTLLCRQHHATFNARFAGYPVRIAQLSRMVSGKDAEQVRSGLADGTLDIVIGTHALLSAKIRFRDLGLLIVDEEQHFGVAHKEALKRLKADVHVLTLTATPIPRTLQMALSGVREMSLIATPPVDRLAVRTFVLPFDPVVVREAILRERYRGGQTFYVCPRIEDLDDVRKSIAELVPEITMISAHGRLSARDLEAAVGAFYDGAYDLLLSTNIIESGLDLPRVNTIIIHRADRFGLAQLYQLRGRVGRSKVRAYAYLTLPPQQKLSGAAEKRLEVMQALDSLGAGFTLASHDLDIRGAGNLLGEEQSGHIREVGIELYQQMLEDAVAEARGGGIDGGGDRDWSPQISLGIGVLIPESYVADLGVRLGLYRRLAGVKTAAEIDAFASELVDRFGALPKEVEHLLEVVAIKQLCRAAGVDRVEAGPKGAVVSFRGDDFANPSALIAWMTAQSGGVKMRPDHRLVVRRDWELAAERLGGVRRLVAELSSLVGGERRGSAAAAEASRC
jgi:transcription-repair coupling factor (superfamily II helicase)